MADDRERPTGARGVWLGGARRAGVLLLAASGCLLGVPAAASSISWDAVRDPRLFRADKLLSAIERSREPTSSLWDEPDLRRLLSERASVLLRLAQVESLPEVRLQFLLGDALVQAGQAHEREAERVLHQALLSAPDSPLVPRALFNLALVAGRNGQHDAEHAAYSRLLELEWDADARATVYLNRAESSLARAQFAAAFEDYHAALTLTSGVEVQALARWGLAVAHERSQNLPRALIFAREAYTIEVPHGDGYVRALDLPSVSFTPEYEQHYYRALALMARATLAPDDAKQSQSDFQSAALLWSMYIDAARADGPVWLANAQRHRRTCRQRALKIDVPEQPEVEPVELWDAPFE